MPVKVPNTLPAAAQLASENIFVMTETRATTQDIRPLRIAVLNLMPTKETTETQLLRLLGNSPLQVEPTFLATKSYTPRHTDEEYLGAFYRSFDDVKHEKFDGLLITGAPVEQMEFEQVQYWHELTEVLDWAREHVYASFFICWAAQAALYHYYGIPKYPLKKKLSGVYSHRKLGSTWKILRGFDDVFFAPHSRHTEVRVEDIRKVDSLRILSVSPEAGVYLVSSRDSRQIFVTGHSEYDAMTLDAEYKRDIAKGLDIAPPAHYYPDDDPAQTPLLTWRAHANLLYTNWLNYYVYQETPYDITQI